MKMMTADEVIAQVTETLGEVSGEYLEHIANQVLSHSITFLEDDVFSLDDD